MRPPGHMDPIDFWKFWSPRIVKVLVGCRFNSIEQASGRQDEASRADSEHDLGGWEDNFGGRGRNQGDVVQGLAEQIAANETYRTVDIDCFKVGENDDAH